MFKNYLDVALRSFLGNKLFSCINVFGFAVGLASVILIGLYVADELSYDRYHPDAERLYRISRDFYIGNGSDELLLATNAPAAAELLQAEFPEVEEVGRIYGGRVLLSRDDVAFYKDGVQFVDPAILRMFAFDWIAGDPATALAGTNRIVLTESIARAYFGAEDPVGKTLTMENRIDLAVTGVIRDLPHNTHIHAQALISLDTMLRVFGESVHTDWGMNAFHTYVKLAPGATIDTMVADFPAFANRHIDEEASNWTGFQATAVPDIHLHSNRQSEMAPAGSMATVVALTTIAAGILIIACFNFMNLATSRAVLRGKEVGVRKTIGAERGHLILQFLGESLGMTLLATLIAIMLVEIAMPAFNGFTGKDLSFDLAGNLRLQAGVLALVAIVGCIAGSYPALYLSAFKPAQVLKSKVSVGVKDVLFRNLLVVLQFSISIVLVIATAVVMLQTRYASRLDLGFDGEQVVVLRGPPSQGLTASWDALRDELLRQPGVVSVTASNIVPGEENLNAFSARVEGAADSRELSYLFVDYGFFETYGVDLLAGRAFSADFPADRIELLTPEKSESTGAFIVNATAARNFGGSPEDIVGKSVELFAGGNNRITGRIVGVVADSNFESARFSVKPLLFMLAPPGIWQNAFPALATASVRISGNDLAGTVARIDSAWQSVLPDFPVTRSFLSEKLAAAYQDDMRFGQLLSSFASLAILIACLGLFGLATFNARRRIKEIGVRKVMGGTVWSIVWLLTSNFSRLVLVSNLIAWPLAWLAMDRWLQNFAYRIDLTPLIFIGSGLIALCIAWVTVGGTAAKAATQKPVLALRYE